MKIAVIGSRKFPSKDVVKSEVRSFFLGYLFPLRLFDNGQGPVFISGCCYGPDKWAEQAVDEINKQEEEVCKEQSGKVWFWKIEKKIYLPDWAKYGKAAGPIRNKLIIDDADFVLAFWDGESKGTKQGIDLTIEQGKCMNIFVRTQWNFEKCSQLEDLYASEEVEQDQEEGSKEG